MSYLILVSKLLRPYLRGISAGAGSLVSWSGKAEQRESGWMAGQRCQERRKIVIQGSLSLSYPMICCFLSVTARKKPAAILLLPCVWGAWYCSDFCEEQDSRVASLPAMTDKDQSQKHPTITFPLLRTFNVFARFLFGATGMEPESGGQEGVVKSGFRGASFACCPRMVPAEPPDGAHNLQRRQTGFGSIWKRLCVAAAVRIDV